MSKHSSNLINLHAEIQKKFMQGNKGDHISLKSETIHCKTPIYNHNYSKINANKISSSTSQNQNVYSHGFQGYFEEKSNYLKNKFDALSLTNNQQQQLYIPNIKYSPKYNKCPVHQSRINMRMRGLEVVDRSVIQKLEENYWSNWKPNNNNENKHKKNNNNNNSVVKTQQIDASSNKAAVIKEEEQEAVEIIHKSNEPYESKSSEYVLNVINAAAAHEEKQVEKTNIGDINKEASNTTMNKNLSELEKKLSKNLTPHLTASEESSESEIVNTIKHTDSLILASRKQQLSEKPHYQQPKCIKLKRKDVNIVKSSRNYVKGGSYPLKSCLKPEKDATKKGAIHLGKPGGSLVLYGQKKVSSQRRLRKK